ncbi:hypothetical protein [Algoriphagus sp. AK58]|uniref:hypothetical protein n=1 Tax=Algoriphagus sp. AK58 TaxID=1406877 RepID=UPI00164F62E5|nr:hypothetical protein [Algoriphagus sp. AK58]
MNPGDRFFPPIRFDGGMALQKMEPKDGIQTGSFLTSSFWMEKAWAMLESKVGIRPWYVFASG